MIEQSLEVDPKLVEEKGLSLRYDAAWALALISAGSGKDVPPLDEFDRAKLRKHVLELLTAELALKERLFETGQREAKIFTATSLKHWQNDSDLASIRDEESLAKLSVDERKSFTRLWDDVAALHLKASTKTESRIAVP